MKHSALAFAATALLTIGCTGSISSSSGEDRSDGRRGNDGDDPGDLDNQIVIPSDGDDPIVLTRPSFSCDESDPVHSVGLRRLTSVQYMNTLRDMIRFGTGGDDTAVQAIWGAIESERAQYPLDGRARDGALATYRQVNQDVQQTHVDEAYNIALVVGKQLTTSARLKTLVGDCAVDGDTGNDDQCITDFINRFGQRALRRPLKSQEFAFYRGFYGDDTASNPAAWADLVGGFLTAPQFLYFVEHGGDGVDGKQDVYKLSAYELASRLSYHFLQTMPDQELWDRAMTGELLDDAEYGRQVDRLMALADARKGTREFFEDFLRLEDVDDMTGSKDQAKFKLFADRFVPSDNLRQAMIDDTLDMVEYHVWNKDNGTLGQLLTSEESFARTPELAGLYGAEVWDGSSEPPLIPSEQERHGLFTRGRFVATGLANTRPIVKGAHLRQFWLCDEIPAPDADAANTPIDDRNLRTRDGVEALTEQAGTACATCHTTLINPLGFATEHFDGLGRFRTEEMLFDGDKLTGTAPVNATTVPRVHTEDPREVTNAGELMELVAESGKVEACIARGYFQYTFARREDEGRDGCVLEDLRKAISGQSTLRDFIREAVVVPEFRQRRIATN